MTAESGLIEWERPVVRRTTIKPESNETDIPERADFTVPAPIMNSHLEPSQDPAGCRTLYVLGFGIAGAILANTLVFIYFASLYASS